MSALREAAKAVYDEFVDDVNERDAPVIFGKLKALGEALEKHPKNDAKHMETTPISMTISVTTDQAHRDACDVLSALGVFSPPRVEKLAAMLRERRTGDLVEAAQQVYNGFLHATSLGHLSEAMNGLRLALEAHFAARR